MLLLCCAPRVPARALLLARLDGVCVKPTCCTPPDVAHAQTEAPRGTAHRTQWLQ